MSYDAEAFDAFEAVGWALKDVASYDTLAGRVTSRLAEPLLDSVSARPGTKLVDVATGPGYVAKAAVTRGVETTGVDFSEGMLQFARARVPDAEFVRGDATALPFADETFSAYIAAFLLLHLGRPEDAATEAARVLEPGGKAAFAVWDVPSRGRWLGVMLDAVTEVGAPPPADLPPGPPLFRFADEDELTGLLADAGFADAAVETIEFALELESSGELWEGLVEGTVRVRPLVLAQSDEVQAAIRARFDELLGEHRSGEGYAVPVSVKIGSGRKP